MLLCHSHKILINNVNTDIKMCFELYFHIIQLQCKKNKQVFVLLIFHSLIKLHMSHTDRTSPEKSLIPRFQTQNDTQLFEMSKIIRQ